MCPFKAGDKVESSAIWAGHGLGPMWLELRLSFGFKQSIEAVLAAPLTSVHPSSNRMSREGVGFAAGGHSMFQRRVHSCPRILLGSLCALKQIEVTAPSVAGLPPSQS